MKTNRNLGLILGLLCLITLFHLPLKAQQEDFRSTAPNVFIDCSRRICDMDYIKTEITFVNYMRDRQNADVHVLITRQTTGSGGNEYTLSFIGLKDYQGRDSTLTYFSRSTDTEAQVREGFVNMLKQGLIPYVSDTPLSEFITVSYEKIEAEKTPPVTSDKWDHWVFYFSLSGNMDLEDLSQQYRYSFSLSANRTTEASKFRFWANTNYRRRKYEISETEKVISQRDRKMVFSQLVLSINDHWSAGGYVHLYSSTYDNANLFATIGPAVEYNIFPYDQSTRRELRIQYRLQFSYRKYDEITIFDKTKENLFQQSLNVSLEIKEPWGSAGMRLEGSNYLHDFSKNNLQFEAGISVRVFKGFSFGIDGEYTRIRDQLSLPKEGASKEEILLELKRLATSYDFSLNLRLSYRFGSIYNNIVNPRFGNR
ncbi:MAG: DUF481 domain-containing protein [Candidatus Aminicenantes bacterium]|nr:DUF481 domain-containing protein [Candidatus Aminicenantes bacterium]